MLRMTALSLRAAEETFLQQLDFLCAFRSAQRPHARHEIPFVMVGQ